ncbi:Predicted PurR-regulated permease PerM [Jatrophihabitans endophyticus]|uniref:Predicted PurR-regulated permease PerM n=1 Tax=Jatrophihabitans endophyticus TaxID=1206085 RepID=A0A1M5C9G8_9ACTN|nr:AI-2E family transporter [Jatrophihabitans endophyticus]SHF51378.1 Predicted PurR-regulated permease PerM [Jatrophihabitans endophyticus]
MGATGDAERSPADAAEPPADDVSDAPPDIDRAVVSTPPGPPLRRDSPFYRGFFLTVGALAALVLALAVRETAAVLTLVLIAGFLAVALEPVVGFVGRRGVGRPWAVLLIGIGLVVVLGGVGYVLGTALRDQVSSLIDNAPTLLDDLRRNRTIRHLDDRFGFVSTLEKKTTDPELGKRVVGGLFGAGLGVVNALVSTVVVFVLMLYFLAARPQITRALYSLAPASRRERVGALGDEILHRVGRYAIGAVVVALIAGTVTAIFSVAAGFGEYALPLAVLVALLDLVPLVGAILGAASVCLVGLATSTTTFIVCVLFYLVYEVIEGYVIYPRVMRSSVDVPEYVTIMAVLLGGAVGGIVGALLALPVAAALLLLVREVWVRRQDTA